MFELNTGVSAIPNLITDPSTAPGDGMLHLLGQDIAEETVSLHGKLVPEQEAVFMALSTEDSPTVHTRLKGSRDGVTSPITSVAPSLGNESNRDTTQLYWHRPQLLN